MRCTKSDLFQKGFEVELKDIEKSLRNAIKEGYGSTIDIAVNGQPWLLMDNGKPTWIKSDKQSTESSVEKQASEIKLSDVPKNMTLLKGTDVILTPSELYAAPSEEDEEDSIVENRHKQITKNTPAKVFEFDEDTMVELSNGELWIAQNDKVLVDNSKLVPIKKGNTIDTEKVLQGYLHTMLWSSIDIDTDQPLDSNYSIEDISDDVKVQAEQDVSLFIGRAGNLIDGLDLWKVGMDFWLTRDHQGAGFWDGDYEKELGKKLTEIAQGFKGIEPYVGDDKKIYASVEKQAASDKPTLQEVNEMAKKHGFEFWINEQAKPHYCVFSPIEDKDSLYEEGVYDGTTKPSDHSIAGWERILLDKIEETQENVFHPGMNQLGKQAGKYIKWLAENKEGLWEEYNENKKEFEYEFPNQEFDRFDDFCKSKYELLMMTGEVQANMDMLYKKEDKVKLNKEFEGYPEGTVATVVSVVSEYEDREISGDYVIKFRDGSKHTIREVDIRRTAVKFYTATELKQLLESMNRTPIQEKQYQLLLKWIEQYKDSPENLSNPSFRLAMSSEENKQ